MSAQRPDPDPRAAEWLAAQRDALERVGGPGLEGLARAWSGSVAGWWEAFGEASAAALCREAFDQTGALAATAEAFAGTGGGTAPTAPWEAGLAEWQALAERLAARAQDATAAGPAPGAAPYPEAAAAFQREIAGLAAALAARSWPAVADSPSATRDVRALYERWLDEGDRAWQAHVSTDRFARALGGLVNAALAPRAPPPGEDGG